MSLVLSVSVDIRSHKGTAMVSSPRLRGRNAKIVATLGPSSCSAETILLLAQAGADIFRLNFSHGTQEDHKSSLSAVRKAEESLNRPLAVLADLQGPKIRIGAFPEGSIRLGFGEEYALIGQSTSQSDNTIPVPHPEIIAALEEGDEILCDDGLISLFVTHSKNGAARVRSEFPARLSDRKGFTIRGKALPVSALTEKDERDLKFALEIGVDLIAQSFVQSVADVEHAKRLIDGRTPLIAKLEKPAAIDCLEGILEISDGVMVARGDLGVEFPVEQVPVIQRKIIRAARSLGRPVIVATQMLESMIDRVTPTRAEASDVATAVYQGADAVMLSAETAVGRHPASAVAIMGRIISAVESAADFRESLRQYSGVSEVRTIDVIAHAAHSLANSEDAVALVLRTGSNRRLAKFAQQRGEKPILYGSKDLVRLRKAQLLWGVHPIELANPSADDWPEALLGQANLTGRVAYAAWKGEGEDGAAWELGTRDSH